jgi:hypothetical protein
MSDFVTIMSLLKEKLFEEEFGPMPQRESWLLFVKWVEASGGTVRGVRRRGQTAAASADNASK